jgi:pyruvate dehydrogenase E2 component (dihydrolipoamide acetyltransferase)
MKHPLLMPKLGLTMTEGALVEWTVKPGDAFAAGATLFVVETEKAATDIAAEDAGVLVEIAVTPGEIVPVGAVLGYWDDGIATSGSALEASRSVSPAEQRERDAPAETTAQTQQVTATAATSKRHVATPLARRMAASRGVDLARIAGSGPNGRIRAADVDAAAQPSQPAPPTSSTARAPTPTQATIARRLAAAKREIPHFYLAVEAEVSRLQDLRAELKTAQSGVRYTLNHFLLAAVGRALRDQPAANVAWTDDAIVQFATSDVGMAVATERGLMAPVLRDVGRMSVAQVAEHASAAIERARIGRLAAADFDGGAITVSNAGMHDVTYMTSIINPGQSMILGVGSVRELFRPDAARQPALRREMGLVLSADHRVHDAVSALAFLQRIVAQLEHPLGLLVA